MAKVRLLNNSTVAIEVTALNALTIAGGSLAGGMPGSEKIIKPQPRLNAGSISWQVPADSGASYVLIVAVPPLAGTPPNGHQVRRSVSQSGGGQMLPPASVNPRLSKLSKKFPNGHFRLMELIDLV